MLTAAGNRQLKRICLNEIHSSQNLHVKFQLSVLPLLSPHILSFIISCQVRFLTSLIQPGPSSPNSNC